MNANRGTERGRDMLEKSLRQYGAGRSILLDKHGRIIAGNKTAQTAAEIGLDDLVVVETDGKQVVAVKRMDLDLENDDDARALAYADNRVAEVDLDFDPLQMVLDRDAGKLPDFWTDDEIAELTGAEAAPVDPADDPGADIDAADELQEKWQTETGQIWTIGEHRLMCGDSTNAGDVALLMNGETAQLIHADPPYGMGKEKEGVANDNLYAGKLDKFQMLWWGAFRPCLDSNASAYIWGNSEDLWRLWYNGGLADSERLTFRNEIVWDKQIEGNVTLRVGGATFDSDRSYTRSERCIFFMLGEQGFNNNADNYWDGWEGVRSKLAKDCELMGWGAEDIKRITGVGMFGHWFTKSQWTLIPAEHYKKLQIAAVGEHDAFKREHDAFKREHDELKREHDELKREFYATRAYFDNTHESMTDVWGIPRVVGDDRHGHPTPKHIRVTERIIKTSCPDGGNVVEPFLGSGTTMAAAEQLGRKCYGMEIDPKYCAVILERMQGMGLDPQLNT
jgi:DNA modification methylase